ncbi:MAG: hypothetical protein AVDCRST_MAG77-3737 [uncultured Chloroflexi bacterium]|uniref:Glycosyltransferase subfamily 4-like N-terminal domain-containing protein n=1 Tax=uncultured Chloroflexota bacterium TaxID=166587 RepID=A0A6J4J4E1_9CHLR|nr:MAG: hypothetical protein AVDCRST_MAG77-3737 [uncultured Chloroflexota bacterium]
MRDRVSDPLRVLLVTDAVGGVWDSCLALAQALGHSGQAKVLLAVVGPPPAESQVAAARAVPGLALRQLDGRLEWMEGGRDWLERHRAAAGALAAEWRADLVHVNQLGLAGVGEALGRTSGAGGGQGGRRPPVLLGVHSDLVTWWTWVKDGGEAPRTLPDYLRWQLDLARHALQQADAVVCPSGFLAGEITRHYQLDRTPHVVHNAVALPVDSVNADDETQEVGRQDDLAVTVAGRAWDEAKNVKLVAEALRLCRRPWRLEVAGEVVEPGRPPSAMPAAPGLSYSGFLDKHALASLLGRAALCIAPASYDPFGLGPAEAALAGCAVVANDIPSYREVWGPAALYFERNTPGALAALLERLSGDRPTVTHYATLAHARVRARYTHERMAAAYLGLYRELLGATRSGGARSTEQLVEPLAAVASAPRPLPRPDALHQTPTP